MEVNAVESPAPEELSLAEIERQAGRSGWSLFLKDNLSPISIESDRWRERNLSGLVLVHHQAISHRSLFSCISLYYYTSQGIILLLSVSFLFSLLLFFAPGKFYQNHLSTRQADLHDLLPAAHSNHSCVSKVTSYPFYIHTSTHWFSVSVTQFFGNS
jgi:hypothetical protein